MSLMVDTNLLSLHYHLQKVTIVEFVFCSVCVTPIASKSGSCPSCRVILTPGTLSDNLFARNAIDGLTVYCSSTLLPAVGGIPKCTWSGPLHLLSGHVSTACCLTPVACSLVGCKELIYRINLPAHLLVCPYRKITCKHCNEFISSNAHLNHTTNCAYRPSVCNLCQTPMQFRSVEAHKRDECGDTLISCPMFKAVGECKGGCSNGQVKRRLLKSHISAPEAMADNFMCLLNKVGQLDSVTQQLKRSNELLAVKLFVASLPTNSRDRNENDLRRTLEKWLSVIDPVNDWEDIAALHKHLTMEKDDTRKEVFVKHIAYDFPNVTDAIVKSTPAEAAKMFLTSPRVKVCGEDEAYSILCQTDDKKKVQFFGTVSHKQEYDDGVKVLCTLFRFGYGKPEQRIAAHGRGRLISLDEFTSGGFISPAGNVHLLCTFMFDNEKFASPMHHFPPGSKKRKLV